MRSHSLALLLVLIASFPLTAERTATADDDPILERAAERIERHRKVDALIQVVDRDGKPLPEARVVIEQVNHEFLFGCNIFAWGKVGDEPSEKAYREHFASLLNFATLPFYWPSYERQQGRPNHEFTEQVARWCREHGIVTKGHPLAWNYSDPYWLPEDLDEVRRLQMARIDDCVSRFRSLIDRWDVVNEATHYERDEFRRRSPKLTELWDEMGRIEFVKECFRHARHANPDATLLINDYRTDPAYERLIEQLKDDQGRPIYDVIGIQSHMHGGTWTSERIWEVCERFARFGAPLHFTETTILSGPPKRRGQRPTAPWTTTPEGEERQADEVERFYTILFSHPAVEAITWWDFSDRRAWQGAPAGLIRKDMSPKPAYNRLLELVKHQWWTRLVGTTGEKGTLHFRGFRGDYQITAIGKDGERVSADARLKRDQQNRITIRLGADS